MEREDTDLWGRHKIRTIQKFNHLAYCPKNSAGKVSATRLQGGHGIQQCHLSKEEEVTNTSSEISEGVNHVSFYSLEEFS